MTTVLRAPIVGMHFNPPAKALVQGLRRGTLVKLVPDPGNQYDNQALKVLWEPGSHSYIPAEEEALDSLLPDYGIDGTKGLAEQSSWMLGHVAKSGGKPLAKLAVLDPTLVGNAELLQSFVEWPQEARLEFLGDGTPVVELEPAS